MNSKVLPVNSPLFASLRKQACGGLVDLGDAALNGVGLLKNIR